MEDRVDVDCSGQIKSEGDGVDAGRNGERSKSLEVQLVRGSGRFDVAAERRSQTFSPTLKSGAGLRWVSECFL